MQKRTTLGTLRSSGILFLGVEQKRKERFLGADNGSRTHGLLSHSQAL